MFRRIGSYMPPPAPDVGSPLQWGSEDHVRELLAHSGAELSFERHTERNEADDGSFSAQAEYLLTVARLPSSEAVDAG